MVACQARFAGNSGAIAKNCNAAAAAQEQPDVEIILTRVLSAVLLLACAFAATKSQAGALAGVVPAPSVDAKSYILVDYRTNAVLAEKNADERVEPASLTKIMTVYAASHALKAGLISWRTK